MYGLRALVIAAGLIAAGLIAAGLILRRAPLVAGIAFAAGGLVQLGDVAIAAHFDTASLVGASVAAVVHLLSAGVVLRHVRHPL